MSERLFDQKILSEIANRISKLVKNEIIKGKHIVTSRMLNDTEAFVVSADEETGELVFKLESTDYFKYVDGRFKILNKGLNIKNNFMSNTEVINLIEDLYVVYFENVLDKSFPKGPGIVKT